MEDHDKTQEVDAESSLEDRPTPALEDPEKARAVLANWLSAKLNATVTIPSLDIPEGTGMSNVTLMLAAELEHPGRDTREKLDLVARIQPQGDSLAFPDYDLAMQCRIMRALKAVAPVPEIVAEEDDVSVLGMPFYVMKKTAGLIPPDLPPYHMDGWLKESSEEQRKTIWYAGVAAMSKVHNVRLEENPVLREALAASAFPKSLSEQLAYWQKYYQWGYAGHVHQSCEKALAWLQDNQPEEQVTRLCWGDSRMANIIVSPEKDAIAALLDWEMATLGDPLQDICWWIYMDELFSIGLGMEPLDGFPGREKTLRYWSEMTGLDTAQAGYYLIFAATRFALILGRMGLCKGNSENIGKSFEADYLNKMLEEFAA